jgi:tetratricopeptide (TPR) repeat protein
MTVLRQIETLQPGDRQALLGIASVYQRRREFDEALEVLHELLLREPHDPKVLERVGQVYTDKRDIPRALEYLHAAENEVDPRNVEDVDALTHRLALAYHHGKIYATAEKLFHRVGESGRSAAFYFDFGVTLEGLGKASPSQETLCEERTD